MKKIIIVLLAAFFAVSCSMQVSDKTGSLTLSGARGVVTDLVGSNASVRYSLTRNGKTIPLNGQSLLEVSGSDSVTIDSLIPGDGYKLGLSAGTKVGNNFVVEYYGYSETFSIAEGTNSAVSVALQTAPAFTWLTSTGGKSSAAVVGGSDIYVLDGTGLSDWPFNLSGGIIQSTANVIGTINSLTTGKYFSDGVGDELWLNTSTGIYRNNGVSWNSNMNPGMSPNVSFSRAVDVSGAIVGLYSGGGSNIGFIYANSVSDFISPPGDGITPWQTAADYEDIADFLPEITQDVIKSVAVNEDNTYGFYYVATPLGTAIGSSTSGTDDIQSLLTIGGDNWLKIPGVTAPINVVSTAGTRVFAGTNFGLYTSIVDPTTGIPDGTGFTLVTGTAGKKIVALESFYNTPIVTAAVTDDNTVLLIEENALTQTLPSAAGIPLNAKPAFYGYSGVHLILSGINGSVDYDTHIEID